jgi:glycosyltransferase involved in cell wall biosynthesis
MLPVPASVIGNPYQDELFHVLAGTARDRDIIFVGRLVSDKGVDVLLDALHSLRNGRGLRPTVTIVGDGPEREAISQQICAYDLDDQVVLAGIQQGPALVKLLNQHKILVVPSRWKEPFGVVALEGIACGCVVVGSADGGLSEAIGPCGVTFPNGDSGDLAAALVPLLTSIGEIERYRSGAANHLRQHSVRSIATLYLKVFRDVVENREHRRLGCARRVSAS